MAYEPRFTVTAHLLSIIEEIAGFRERIQAATVQVPWIPALQRDSRTRNTHASTAIEGNPLTLEQVVALEEGRPIVAASERARREILNYLAALRRMEKQCRVKRITHEHILKLHALIGAGVMDQGLAGVYRHIQVIVGHHKPPPPEVVSGMMAELLAWWNAASGGWSPVISSAVIHYTFEEIHPFADGNGRTGRMLALWELYRRGFDTHHIFTVDEVLWENRSRYYHALDAVRGQGGDLTGWLEFSAETVHLAMERVWMRIQKLAAASSSAEKIVLRPKQERLLGLLRDHQALAPREIRELLGVSRQGAMDIINPLLRAGLVKRIGTIRSGKYILGG
jgi:Fic family protein